MIDYDDYEHREMLLEKYWLVHELGLRILKERKEDGKLTYEVKRKWEE